MFALVDCNTFYSSCEAIFNPAIRGKPVVVLSNNDGCIISRNAEAKTLDIPDIVPFYQVRALLQKHRVQVFSSNYELYGDISARVMRILRDYAVQMEEYSIDEAFLSLHTDDMKAHGCAIRDALWQQIRMPVCIGIAQTKTLAKAANRTAKKDARFNGVCVLDNEERRRWVLARTPLDGIWGVGRRLKDKLQALGFDNALQLSEADATWLRRRFSVVLERTIRELRGEPCLDLELVPEPKQEIISSRSFSYKITSSEELQQAICTYAARACEKLRLQNGLARQLWVYAESSRQKQNHFYRHRYVTLPHPTNDTRVIAHFAAQAMAEIYRPGVRFKKCGIGLLGIQTRLYEQMDFFAGQQTQRSRDLMATLDRVNQRYGKNTVKLANTGINPPWTMNRQFKSPAYTTRWSDIPVVRC